VSDELTTGDYGSVALYDLPDNSTTNAVITNYTGAQTTAGKLLATQAKMAA